VGCRLVHVKGQLRKAGDDFRRGKIPPGTEGAVKHAREASSATAPGVVGGWGGALDGIKERSFSRC